MLFTDSYLGFEIGEPLADGGGVWGFDLLEEGEGLLPGAAGVLDAILFFVDNPQLAQAVTFAALVVDLAGERPGDTIGLTV
jgi:hypothetical protein